MKTKTIVFWFFWVIALLIVFSVVDIAELKQQFINQDDIVAAPVPQPRSYFVEDAQEQQVDDQEVQDQEADDVQDTEEIDEADADFVNTEWTWLPEIIVDEDAFNDLPENEEWEVSFGDIDDASGDLEDVSIKQAVEQEFLPESINLDIPFYTQAPEGDRSLPWKEACEESSIILAAYFMNNESLWLTEFKQEVYNLVDLQNEMFGKYIDTSVAETKELFDAYYGIWRTQIIDNPTIEEMKYHLAQWHPIVAPFAWKLLGNSNFTNGWPRYHMLVIKGYDDEYFYTNDVWTKRGKDFPYTYDVIMNSLHDLVPVWAWDITNGAKRILVLTK